MEKMEQIIAAAPTIPAAKKETVIYTGKTHTAGGRDNGTAISSDGKLNIRLCIPGSNGEGTNPEQLFAAGWSACFEGALAIAAGKMNIKLPADTAIDAEVDLCTAEGQFFLQARLNISLPGLDIQSANSLVQAAHKTCPYSKATSGNISVTINLVF